MDKKRAARLTELADRMGTLDTINLEGIKRGVHGLDGQPVDLSTASAIRLALRVTAAVVRAGEMQRFTR